MKNYDDALHAFVRYMNAEIWDELDIYEDDGMNAICAFIQFIKTGGLPECVRCGRHDIYFEYHDADGNPYCEYCWDDLFN